jgi:hypothetical protein
MRNSNRTIKALLFLSAGAQPRTVTGRAVGVSDGDRAIHRQPQQQDLSLAELPGLFQKRLFCKSLILLRRQPDLKRNPR